MIEIYYVLVWLVLIIVDHLRSSHQEKGGREMKQIKRKGRKEGRIDQVRYTASSPHLLDPLCNEQNINLTQDAIFKGKEKQMLQHHQS